MRTWILFSAIILCETISPGMEYSETIGYIAITLGVIGIGADLIEFGKKVTQ